MESIISILIIAVVVVLLLHPGVKPRKSNKKHVKRNPAKEQAGKNK